VLYTVQVSAHDADAQSLSASVRVEAENPPAAALLAAPALAELLGLGGLDVSAAPVQQALPPDLAAMRPAVVA